MEERDGEEEEEGENDGRTSPEELVQQYMERVSIDTHTQRLAATTHFRPKTLNH